MKNDLSKLSDTSLSERQFKCNEAEKFIAKKFKFEIDRYNSMISRNWVRPTKLLELKGLMEIYSKTLDMLREYSNTLLDEYNRRL